jgi:hypothetical protein
VPHPTQPSRVLLTFLDHIEPVHIMDHTHRIRKAWRIAVFQ